jgi:hypothetical protein
MSIDTKIMICEVAKIFLLLGFCVCLILVLMKVG